MKKTAVTPVAGRELHQSILQYRGGRYGWWALLLIVLSVLLYASQGGLQPPNGGTWQGYVLGTVGLALIAWLAALGVVKRRYGKANVRAWTSAHVYLGTALLLVASLHADMQLGFNVHTLAYVLMVLVIGSGLVGLYFYRRYPREMAQNRHNRSRQELFAELSELNNQGQELASRCHVNVRTAVDTAIARTAIGGGLLDQLLGLDTSRVVLVADEQGGRENISNRDQEAIIDYVAKCIPRSRKAGEADNLQNLLEVLCRRQTVTRQLRQDIAYTSRLKVWLWIHVPVTVGLLVALILHVIAVFFYW